MLRPGDVFKCVSKAESKVPIFNDGDNFNFPECVMLRPVHHVALGHKLPVDGVWNFCDRCKTMKQRQQIRSQTSMTFERLMTKEKLVPSSFPGVTPSAISRLVNGKSVKGSPRIITKIASRFSRASGDLLIAAFLRDCLDATGWPSGRLEIKVNGRH